jgi:dCMP deaminase
MESNSNAPENGPFPPYKTLKRENVVEWDDYFMAVAFLTAMRSKDPTTQIGACIVN